ncbi:hypothetical protein BGZ90_007847, partial [Linnemannia elongata]
AIATANAIASSSSSSSSISRCIRCRGNDHQRSTSRRCPYFKGKQTTSARISYSQEDASNNYDYLEAIFETIPDDDILAALTDIIQDQDLNTTSQSNLVEDMVRDQDLNTTSQSTLVEDMVRDQDLNTTRYGSGSGFKHHKSIYFGGGYGSGSGFKHHKSIYFGGGYGSGSGFKHHKSIYFGGGYGSGSGFKHHKSIYFGGGYEPTLATPLEGKASNDQERPLTQAIPTTASRCPSSSSGYTSTMLDEQTTPIHSAAKLNTTSGSMVVLQPNAESTAILAAASVTLAAMKCNTCGQLGHRRTNHKNCLANPQLQLNAASTTTSAAASAALAAPTVLGTPVDPVVLAALGAPVDPVALAALGAPVDPVALAALAAPVDPVALAALAAPAE